MRLPCLTCPAQRKRSPFNSIAAPAPAIVADAADRPDAAAAARLAEAANVKLRYKLPDGDTSKLIEQPVPASALKAATLPKGDFAFAAAVAAFGQVLRGDEMMMGFGFGEIERLAGEQNTAGQDNYWRQEFLRLNALAGSMKGG